MKDKPTKAELEPSPCTNMPKRCNSNEVNPRRWQGMNERDETDPVTLKPIGRMLADGFRMNDPNY